MTGSLEPGPLNLITDVAGLNVGNAEDQRILTGTTVIVPDRPMVAAADVRGGAPGTRELALLEPENLVEEIHAIVLSGGSVFGLDAASSVTWKLAQGGAGLRFGAQPWPCPIVSSAILFDLINGGGKSWANEPPYRRLGLSALAAIGKDFKLGNAGAGAGAIAGGIKGGLGSASTQWNGITIGALVAVNCVGSCFNSQSGLPWAMDYAIGAEMGSRQPLPIVPPELGANKLDLLEHSIQPGQNTTIAVVAVDAQLSKGEAKRLAIMGGDGLAIAIRPLHTPFDGDSVFAAATGVHEIAGERSLALARLGAIAAQTLARAVGRALFAARSAGGCKAWQEVV